MSISSRIHDTLESWQAEWKDRLRGWCASWVMNGILRVMDFLEPDLRAEIKPSLLRIRDIPGLPDDMKDLIDKTVAEPGAVHFMAILPYLVGILIGLGMGAAAPMARIGSYQIDQFIRSARLDPLTAIRAFWRGFISEARLKDALKDQGWSDDDIVALRNVTKFYPPPADLVRFQAREVFEPKMIERYGLDSEYAEIDKEPFYKAGMDDEQILNYWRAHWEHASYMQMVEMLHRKLITEDDFKAWFRLVEIVPFWRDMLLQTAYTWPTRVDVRRWWDMRTIGEPRLKELYEGMGYRGKNLEDYIKWTKVYVDFPMMMARFKNGWITEEDIREWLRRLEIPEGRINQFIEEKTKPEQPARVASERDLTKADIIKWVKKDLERWDQGIELLMDLGYDRWEADTILDINISVEAGSPETFPEFKRLTQKYRVAAGLEAKPMSEELKATADEVVRITKEIEDLNRAIEDEKRGLIDEEILPAETTARLEELQVSRNRAEAELFRVKSDYDRLLAEWRHGA